MKKRSFFAVFLLIVTVVGVVVFLFILDQQKLPEQSAVPLSSPPAVVEKNTTIDLYPDQPQGVRFYIKTPLSPPPKELPLYTPTYLASAQMLDIVTHIATKLGFVTNPLTVGPPDNQTWVWNSGDTSLSFQERPPVISFSGNVSLNTVGFTFAEVGEKSISFLTSLGFSLNNLILAPVSLEPFEETEGENFNEGLYLLTLSLNIDGKYPFQTSGVPNSVTIIVDKNGNLRSFSFPIPPKITSSPSLEPILTLDLALINLNNNKGTLVSLEGESTNEYLQPQPNYKEVEVVGYTIIYYLNQQQTALLPAYLITGIGRGDKTDLQVVYLLNAL